MGKGDLSGLDNPRPAGWSPESRDDLIEIVDAPLGLFAFYQSGLRPVVLRCDPQRYG